MGTKKDKMTRKNLFMIIALFSITATMVSCGVKKVRAEALEFVLYEKLQAEDGERPESGGKVIYAKADVLLNALDVEGASTGMQKDSGTGKTENVVNVKFTSYGTEIFAEITRDHVGEQLAMITDGRLLSAPLINCEIDGGEAVISGNLTYEEAQNLANALNGE